MYSITTKWSSKLFDVELKSQKQRKIYLKAKDDKEMYHLVHLEFK